MSSLGDSEQSGAMTMRIGELAQHTGTSPRQLRHYEARGLLQSRRLPNGYRDYPSSEVERIRQIRTLLDSGFTTALIAEFLPCLEGADAELTPHPDPDLANRLRREISRIDRKISALTLARERFTCYLNRVT